MFKKAKIGFLAVLSVLSATVAVPSTALAVSAIPTSVESTYTSMGSDFTTIFGYAFTPMILIVGSMLVWRYAKKLGNKI